MRGLAAIALWACLWTGTSAVQADAGTLPGSSLRASGFLGNHADLAKVPGRLDTWQWVRAGVHWKPYDKILVQTIELWINTQAAYPGIEPGLYKQLTDHFRQTLTGVTPERPPLTPLDILPIKLAFNVVRGATGTDKTVIALSGEVEALDAVSGQRLYAQVTTRKDAHLFVAKNLSWEDVREAATERAEQARARLDKARCGQP